MLKKKRYAIAASAGLIVAAFAVYYSVGSGESDPGRHPQVSGRLLTVQIGDGPGGYSTLLCEYDAQVGIVEGNVVVKVLKEGSRGVEVGSKVIAEIFTGYVEGRGEGPSGVQYLGVYWGEDGNLYAGCAPESMAELDDGTIVNIKDLPKPDYSQP